MAYRAPLRPPLPTAPQRETGGQLAFGLLACDGNANETDEPEVIVEYPNNGVPDAIQASFAADHPNATDVEWDVDDDHYEVEFRLNGDKMEIEYDFNGRKIDFED